jgi:asparagine synthase (glutamine-hydrolysing)
MPFAPSAFKGDAGLNTANLSHYLTLQYVPEPHTLHYGISRVGSGECFSFTPGGEVVTRRYYRAEFHPTRPAAPIVYRRHPGHAAGELCGCTCARTVPVGAFLSPASTRPRWWALSREFNPNILTFHRRVRRAGVLEIEWPRNRRAI